MRAHCKIKKPAWIPNGFLVQSCEKLIATCLPSNFDSVFVSSAIVSRADGEFVSWFDVGGIRSCVGVAIASWAGHLVTGGLSHLFDMFRTFLSVGV